MVVEGITPVVITHRERMAIDMKTIPPVLCYAAGQPAKTPSARTNENPLIATYTACCAAEQFIFKLSAILSFGRKYNTRIYK